MRKSLVVLLTSLALVLGFAAMAQARAAAAYKVTLHTSKTASEAGRFITVSGKVTGPKAAGKTVNIQRKYVGGVWTTVAFAKISSSGAFSARVETPRGGTTSFRAFKPRSSVRTAGVSAAKSLKVYRWINLATQSYVIDNGYVFSNAVQKIGTKSYLHSMDFSDGDTTLAYKVGGLCTKLTTVEAYVAPGPAVVDSLTFTIDRQSTGGVNSSTSRSINLGAAPQTISTSLVGSRYFDLNVSSLEPSYDFLLGDPKVYCNADELPAYDVSDQA